MNPIRVAVVGAGAFGRNHMRVLKQLPQAELSAIVDIDRERATAASAQFGCPAYDRLDALRGAIDAAVVAVPTSAHDGVACELMDAGIDVLVEKPIARDRASAQRIVETAARSGRILQIGHLERFNPAIMALNRILNAPVFFEIHRLSLFSPRSLDIVVVLDLMIHDLDLVLHLSGMDPNEIRAAGISILSDKVDIANVRLAFPTGCVANLTASRVSTERVRKLRVFQPHQYVSLDYSKQEAAVFSIKDGQQIDFQMLPVEKGEPLHLELSAFLECLALRKPAPVSGVEGLRALDAALTILAKIEEHRQVVAQHVESLR